MKNKKKVKVGIVANEFLDPEVGRLGGFGWAARRAAEVFNSDSEFEAVLLTPRISRNHPGEVITNNTRLLFRTGKRYKDMIRLMAERIDILLTIDYRTDYNQIFDCLPVTPIVTWVRDPRTPDDLKKMMALKIPGKNGMELPGLHADDSRSLAGYMASGRLFKRKVLLANKVSHLTAKNRSTYGMPPSNHVLPNPDVIDYGLSIKKPAKPPRVIYLGRLDPIKRPWLFIELARHFPDVEFVMMGKDHFEGNGWDAGRIPDNVKMTGHLNGAEKQDYCSSARVLVNTSIHEESPVSVFEALASETPVLSYEDWGGIVERFGITIGQYTGTGQDGMPALVEGLSRLLSDHTLRTDLGRAGRLYVEKEHNDQQFLNAFRKLCAATGRPKLKRIHQTKHPV